MSEKIQLYLLKDITEPGAKEFYLKTSIGELSIFVVRKDGHIYAYRNRCSHTHVLLDWTPDQFLDISKTQIQCATYGALFRIHDGYCTYGPCVEDSLSPVSVVMEQHKLYLAL